MPNPATEILEHINDEVGKLSTVSLSRMTAVLDAAEVELTQDLAKWIGLGKGADRFTPQLYRNALLQIRKTLVHIRGQMAEDMASVMRHGGQIAGHLATAHLAMEVQAFSGMFEHSIRPIAFEASSVIAEGSKTVIPRFKNSAARYAGQVGEDIRKQLAIGLVRGETVDQMTTRLAKLGGPKGLVYTRGMAGSPNARAEVISEGLFRRYRHFAERLVVTETVNAYNTYAMTGMDHLESEDPGYFKRWDGAVDRRTCDFCARYDDVVVKLDESFPGGVKHPPLHPRCRCAVVVWRKEWTESKFKDDLLKESIGGKEPKGVAAIPHRIKTPTPPKKEKAPKEVKAKKETKKEIKAREEAERIEAQRLYKEKTLKAREEAIKESTAKREKWEKWEKSFSDKLTPQEKESIHAYGRYAYGDMNDLLRHGKLTNFSSPRSVAEIAEYNKNMTSALAKAPKLEQPITVYRGMQAPEYTDHLKPGDRFEDKGFGSTSVERGPAEGFARWDRNKPKGAIFEITLPTGTRAAPLPTEMMGEKEILMRPNAQYKITSVEEVNGQKVIKAELIPHE